MLAADPQEEDASPRSELRSERQLLRLLWMRVVAAHAPRRAARGRSLT